MIKTLHRKKRIDVHEFILMLFSVLEHFVFSARKWVVRIEFVAL